MQAGLLVQWELETEVSLVHLISVHVYAHHLCVFQLQIRAAAVAVAAVEEML